MRNANGAEIRKMRALAEKRNERLDGGGFWRTLDLALTLFAVVVFALAVRGAIIEPVRVEGSSMFDTLENGDYMFVEKLTYAFSAPQKGDIVICYYPDEYYETFQKAYRTRVKRVVAVAGDTVQTVDGALYVNGVCAEEPYLDKERRLTTGLETPVTLQSGEVLALGDNRINSNDSRNPLVGPIPLERIIGKAHFVIFPLSHLHGV